MTGNLAAAARERRALQLSIAVSIGFTAVALVWGLVGNSQVILLDAIFTPLSMLMTWGALAVSRLVGEGPSRRFPFGRDALIPLFVIAQAMVLFGALGYAVFEAVRVIRSGGSQVSGLSLLAYGGFSGVVCLGAWWMLKRMANGQSLVEAEAAGWLSAAGSSVVIVVGGLGVLLIAGTPWQGFAPYADSVMVILSSLVLVVVPIGLLRTSVRELQNPAPDPVTTRLVTDAVAAVSRDEGLPEPIVRVGRLGAVVTLELAYVLEPGTGDVACEDRVRRGVRAGLADLPYQLWVVVEFSHDAELVG